jgi:hypothetical protein
MLSPTPRASLTDRQGRPYFLWDVDLSLDEFRERLRSPERGVRDFFLAKLLRQAKPDDALQFVTLAEIATSWPRIELQLGRQRDFWRWLLARKGLDAGADG